MAEIFCAAMIAGACMLLLAGFPVALTLGGISIVLAFVGHAAGAFDVALLNALPSRLYALMNRETLVAVPLFIFMGVTLERSGVAGELLDAMGRLFGRVRGGLAVSVTLVGMLLAASTGIVGATVVTLGLLSLPAMMRGGYGVPFAAGSVAAVGTLGQIIPPSIVLIFLADQLSIAYQTAQFASGNAVPEPLTVSDLFAGALLPGLMLVMLYAGYQLLHARRVTPDRPTRGGAIDARRSIRALAAPLLLIVAVLGAILAGVATATEAASIGAVGALALAAERLAPRTAMSVRGAALAFAALLIVATVFDLRLGRDVVPVSDRAAIAVAALLSAALAWGVLRAVLALHAARDAEGQAVLQGIVRRSLGVTAMIFLIVIGASLFALVFRGFGGDRLIEGYLSGLPGGPHAALLAVIAVMFVLGFFLDFLEIVFVVVPLVAPVLLQMEVAPGVLMSPLWLGVLMGLVLQTSFLTPPFGLALFYLRGVAPDEVRTIDIYRGVVPFVGLQLLALAVVWWLPVLATWLPEMLYGK